MERSKSLISLFKGSITFNYADYNFEKKLFRLFFLQGLAPWQDVKP